MAPYPELLEPVLCFFAISLRMRDIPTKKAANRLTLSVLHGPYNVIIMLYRGYYMPALGYEFYLRVVNSISHE